MKYYPYIYCRTLKKDFRTMCYPVDSIIPKSKQSTIEDFVQQVMNTDNASNGLINEPRYTFMYLEECILWGVGVNNDMIKMDDYCLSEKLKRSLRTFVGIIIPIAEFENLETIPTSLDFFSQIFNKYVVPYWNYPEKDIWYPTASECENEWFSQSEVKFIDNKLRVNNDNDKCVFFSVEDKDDLLSAIKKCKTNIVTGLNVEAHVSGAKNARTSIHFANVVCKETVQTHTEKFIANSTGSLQSKIGKTEKDVPAKKRAQSPQRKESICDKIKMKLGIKKMIAPNIDKTQENQERLINEHRECMIKAEKKDSTSPVNIKKIEIDDSLMDWGDNWNEETKEGIGKTQSDIALLPNQLQTDELQLDIYNRKKNGVVEDDHIQLQNLLIKVRISLIKDRDKNKSILELIEQLLDELQ